MKGYIFNMENNKETEKYNMRMVRNIKSWIKKNRSSKNPFVKITI